MYKSKTHINAIKCLILLSVLSLPLTTEAGGPIDEEVLLYLIGMVIFIFFIISFLIYLGINKIKYKSWKFIRSLLFAILTTVITFGIFYGLFQGVRTGFFSYISCSVNESAFCARKAAIFSSNEELCLLLNNNLKFQVEGENFEKYPFEALPSERANCLNAVILKRADANDDEKICLELPEKIYGGGGGMINKNQCLQNFNQVKKSKSICELMSENIRTGYPPATNKDYCYELLAADLKDKSICNKIKNVDTKQSCLNWFIDRPY